MKSRFLKSMLSVTLTALITFSLVSCGKLFGKEDEENNEHTHSYGEWETITAATCTEKGSEKRVCNGEDCTEYEEREIAALGHDEVSHEAKAATCTEGGYKAYVSCTRCIYSTYEEVAALGHDEVSHEAKEPSCTEVGHEAYVSCTRCIYSTYVEIPVTHDYLNGACRLCGTPHSHEYGDWYGNTATCQAGGKEYRDCTGCDVTDERATDVGSHKYENRVCVYCGKKDYTLPVQPLGENEEE